MRTSIIAMNHHGYVRFDYHKITSKQWDFMRANLSALGYFFMCIDDKEMFQHARPSNFPEVDFDTIPTIVLEKN